MADRDQKSCLTCLFFDDEDDLTDEDGFPEPGLGHCRHNAPHPKHGWPRVHDLDWCGQWQEYTNRMRTYLPTEDDDE